MEIDRFHPRSVNGIKQELFAVLIMSVIARTLTALVMSPSYKQKTVATPQFKHAITTLAADAMVLICAKPKIPKPSQPRVSKQPQNKWRIGKQKKIAAATDDPVSSSA